MSDALHEMRSFRSEAETCAAAEARQAFAASALVRRVRWHTGLSREEFAHTFRIDLDHLRALERGETEPDSAMAAYLTVIDRAPDMVRHVLLAC